MARKNKPPAPPPVTPRLRTCFDAGGVVALFPVLKDWSRAELRALLADVKAYSTAVQPIIAQAHADLALKTENFFSRERSASIDKAKQQIELDLLGVCSEICSVAYFYLGDEDHGN
jgi:hypothetical protein